MTITNNELLSALAQIAPEGIAEEWDNSGVQIFTGKKQADIILVALDITENVISEAIEKRADWIVTHHPLFFDPLKSINYEEAACRFAVRLIQENICVYAAHTSFDSASGGNHDYLARLLDAGLEKSESEPQAPTYMYVSKELCEPIPLSLLCCKIKKSLQIENEIPYVGNRERPIHKIAICPGSGGSLIRVAKDCGCDAYITGDVKYHDAQMAKQLDICVIDAGHYATENTFSLNMAMRLDDLLGDRVKIYSSKACENPFKYFTP